MSLVPLFVACLVASVNGYVFYDGNATAGSTCQVMIYAGTHNLTLNDREYDLSTYNYTCECTWVISTYNYTCECTWVISTYNYTCKCTWVILSFFFFSSLLFFLLSFSFSFFLPKNIFWKWLPAGRIGIGWYWKVDCTQIIWQFSQEQYSR